MLLNKPEIVTRNKMASQRKIKDNKSAMTLEEADPDYRKWNNFNMFNNISLKDAKYVKKKQLNKGRIKYCA